mmetsp:Transcript_12941/g.22686  ORF Transcript_12941/g.22686 Transcript_12941/m.22686 type:complete len:82 (-) Transcript_12941:67-312(-)
MQHLQQTLSQQMLRARLSARNDDYTPSSSSNRPQSSAVPGPRNALSDSKSAHHQAGIKLKRPTRLPGLPEKPERGKAVLDI